MKFELFYPVHPINYNQGFGSNAAYYAKFLDDFGHPEKGHNGVDLAASHGQPVYAAHDGVARTVGPDSHGGYGVYIRTTVPDDLGRYFNTIYWHFLPPDDKDHPAPFRGLTVVKRGDLIGYADNSGAPFESSGDHLHLGLAQCDVNGVFLNRTNGFNGCINPTPFFNGQYATDTTPPPPPSIAIAIQAAQKATDGNLPLANLLYVIVDIVRTWWKA